MDASIRTSLSAFSFSFSFKFPNLTFFRAYSMPSFLFLTLCTEEKLPSPIFSKN